MKCYGDVPTRSLIGPTCLLQESRHARPILCGKEDQHSSVVCMFNLSFIQILNRLTYFTYCVERHLSGTVESVSELLVNPCR